MMRIAILAFPGAQLLDVVGPLDVFSDASLLPVGPRSYELEIVGLTAEPIVGSSRLKILPDRMISAPEMPVDTILVAGSHRIHDFATDPSVQDWLRRQASLARRYGSICNGAFALAAAGLLDGRRVTTHWACTDELAASYPALLAEPDRIFIRDGHVYTSAGVTAGIDLALALVEEDFDRAAALAVARKLVVFLKRPGGQSQFSAHLAAQVASKSVIQEVQAWILENLTLRHSVSSLAKRARMSTRNFARTFRGEAHVTPASFVEAARIDAARRMIEETSLPLKLIAARCGFGDAASLRRAFLRRLGTSPSSYAERFRTAIRSPQAASLEGEIAS